MKTSTRTTVLWIALGTTGIAAAQEPPPPTPTPAVSSAAAAAADAAGTAEKEKVVYRPIESNVIVNLPSVDVPSAGTLTLLVTHRFIDELAHGNINNFFTLDNGNTWAFGIWYAPLKNLNVGFYRTSDLATYEASAQYELPSIGGFGSSLRVGEDWRTQVFDDNTVEFPIAASPKSSFFAQAVLAYSFGPYVRITAVPTYLQRTNRAYVDFQSPPPGDSSCRPSGNPILPFSCSGLYENVFNVPVAASIAITHSITVHGEVTPRLSDVNSRGVGWAVTVEKSLLRHRFAFFVGNQRATTVDQYTGSVPLSRSPNNVYIGFNLYRAWKLN
jgi:hypothetical protein